MLQKLQDRIAAALVRRSITLRDDIYQYLILIVALVYCLLIHLFLLAAYAAYGMLVFAGYNAFSVLLYGGMLVAHLRWRAYTPVAVVIAVEVSGYAAFTAYMTGIQTYILGYFVLVFILQVILPYGTPRLRFGVFCGALVLLCVSVGFHFRVMPPLALPGSLFNLLLVANLFVLAVGSMVELLVGNVVANIIEASNDIRLAELTSLANTDSLTGLYNRRYAEQYLAEILANKNQVPYCVAMLDIDDFKTVNDTLGHASGDNVLVFLAQYLVGGLRKTDTVFRWGGEELLIILEGVQTPTAQIILDKLRRELAKTDIPTVNGDVTITVTIGLAKLDLRNPQRSIQQCDSNLYRGKQAGKNQVVATARQKQGGQRSSVL